MTDKELLSKYAIDTSEEAFEELFERHKRMIYSTCLRRLNGNKSQAEDAMQAVFVALADKAGDLRIEEGRTLAGWLFQTGRRVTLHMLRGERHRIKREKIAVETAERARTMQNDATWEDVGKYLDEVLDLLPVHQRDAVIGYYLESISQKEIAMEAGCTVSAINMRIGTGLKTLRKRLMQRGIAVTTTVLATFLSREAIASVPPDLIKGKEFAKEACSSKSAKLQKARQMAKNSMRKVISANVKMAIGGLIVAGIVAIAGIAFLGPPTQALPELVPLEEHIVTAGNGTVLPQKIEIYGNFETMGVIADLPEGSSVAQIRQAKCFLKKGEKWMPVHDLVQVGSQNWYATSLFYLSPDTAYQIKVEFYDQEGKLISCGETEGRTRKDPVLPKPQAKLFVSPSGDDAAAGEKETPLKTIRKALSIAKAGTTIYLRKGVYHEGGLTFARSGTKDSPIVLRSYEKERAIIDGSEPALVDGGKWIDEGNGIYSHRFQGKTMCASVEDKASGKWTRLYPANSREDLNETYMKKNGLNGVIYCDGQKTYVKTQGAISGYRVHVSKENRAFVLEDRKYLYFDGLEIRNYGRGMFGAVAYVLNTSNTLWQNCRMLHNNTGLWVKKDSHNNTFQDNEYIDDINEWAWQLVKDKGFHNYAETGAVYIEASYYGRGMVIRRNKIRGVFDGAHLSPFVKIQGRTSETDFYSNIIMDANDDFLETDGYSRNVRIFGNTMRGSLSGISLAQALDGPTFITHNIISNCGVCQATRGDGFEGYPFKTNGGENASIGSGHVFFYHNTSHSNDPKSKAMRVQRAKWRKLTFRNNIWCGKVAGLESWQASLSPMDWDYDNLYVESGGPLMKLGKTVFNGLNDLQAKGYLQHGLAKRPKFTNAEKGDYKLQANSPCIDKGVLIPGINDDFEGESPDLGALELGKSLPYWGVRSQ